MMKHYITKILATIVGVVAFVSCTIHDPIDDLAFTGHKAPFLYWEQLPVGVPAGDSVNFELSYYPSKGNEVGQLQIWYDIYLKTTRVVSSPLTSPAYQIDSIHDEIVREFVPVMGYEHSESLWNEERQVYFLNGKFPTTYTLAPQEWKDVEVYDKDLVEKYFSKGFEESFRDSVFSKMKVADFRKVFTVTHYHMADSVFDKYIKCEFDSISGRTECFVLPEHLVNDNDPANWGYFRKLFYDTDSIPNEALFYDAGTMMYKFEYAKNYSVRAKFKVVDKKGTVNYSEEKTIELQ